VRADHAGDGAGGTERRDRQVRRHRDQRRGRGERGQREQPGEPPVDREGAGHAIQLSVDELRKSLRVRHADLGVGDPACPYVGRCESDHLLGQVDSDHLPPLAGEFGGREQHRAAPGRDVKDVIARLHRRKLDESATEPAKDGRADPIVVPRSPAKDAGPQALHRIKFVLHPARSQSRSSVGSCSQESGSLGGHAARARCGRGPGL
jgi:hypothetical protein